MQPPLCCPKRRRCPLDALLLAAQWQPCYGKHYRQMTARALLLLSEAGKVQDIASVCVICFVKLVYCCFIGYRLRQKSRFVVRFGDHHNMEMDEGEQEFEIDALILHEKYSGKYLFSSLTQCVPAMQCTSVFSIISKHFSK